MTDIDVSPETLRQSADDADTAADGISLARSASDQALSDNAFGLMCSPFCVPPYLLVKTAADLMMEAAGKAVGGAAQNLRTAASDLEAVDQDSAWGSQSLYE